MGDKAAGGGRGGGELTRTYPCLSGGSTATHTISDVFTPPLGLELLSFS